MAGLKNAMLDVQGVNIAVEQVSVNKKKLLSNDSVCLK